MFNVREGFSRVDDTLPKRFLKEFSPEGPSKGEIVELDYMLDEYHHYRGWNSKSIPTPEKLTELDSKCAIDDVPSESQ